MPFLDHSQNHLHLHSHLLGDELSHQTTPNLTPPNTHHHTLPHRYRRLDCASLLQVMPLVLADKDDLKTQAHQVRGSVYGCARKIVCVCERVCVMMELV